MKGKKFSIGSIVTVFLLILISPAMAEAHCLLQSDFFHEMKVSDPSITIDPLNPTGNFDWYINPVNVSFYTIDPAPSSGLDYIKYRIITQGQNENPQWITYDITEYTTSYNLTITLSIDGRHNVEFYAADKVGNIGVIHSTDLIKIDMTPPEISLTKDRLSIYQIKFTANANDITSEIYTVKFYLDEELIFESTTSPYEYIWTGLGNHTISAKGFDYAGNEANTQMSTSKSYKAFSILERLNNYFL